MKICPQIDRFSCFSIPNGLQWQNIFVSTVYFNVVNVNVRSRLAKFMANEREILPHCSEAHQTNQNCTSDDSKRWSNLATYTILVIELKNNDLCSDFWHFENSLLKPQRREIFSKSLKRESLRHRREKKAMVADIPFFFAISALLNSCNNIIK